MNNNDALHHPPTQKTIICIGTSTGGPRALEEVLSYLPKSVPAPIVIVQHMPPKFTNSLANRLNGICTVNVKEAKQGESLKNGTAYIAPGGKHLQVNHAGIIQISEQPLVNGHRPSVDVLFESISKLTDYRKIAIIMTGMGADGANGIRKLKEKDPDVFVIAESKKTSIVYGMPKAAIETKLVDRVVELPSIAQTIIESLYQRGGE